MIDAIINKEYKSIEKKAQTEKSVVDFLRNYVDENYSQVSEAFYSRINTDFEKNIDKLKKYNPELNFDEIKDIFFIKELYSEVKDMFNSLDIVITRKVDLTKYDKEKPHPYEKIGFAVINSENNKKSLTEKGKEQINKYREVKGLCSLDEYKSLINENNFKEVFDLPYMNLKDFKDYN